MKLKLNPVELNKVCEIIQKDGMELGKEINNLNNYIKEIQLIWKGIDSDNFCVSFNAYLENLKKVPIALNDIEVFINRSNKIYCEADRDFAKLIERNRKDYE